MRFNWQNYLKGFLSSSILMVSVFGLSCASQTSIQSVTQGERVKWNRSFGDEVAQQLRPRFKFKQDIEVSAFLKNMARKLVEFTPEIAGSVYSVLIVRDRDLKWRNFGIPNQSIYLSNGLLRELDFENEVAAILAIQLAHIMNKNLQAQFARAVKKQNIADSSIIDTHLDSLWSLKNKEIDYLDPKGIFCFSEKSELIAVQTAVGILYRAGYDSRGLISLFDRYNNRLDRSPYNKKEIDDFIEQARREIAVYAPLRNPIVRTQKFLLIQKRIKNL